MSVKWLKSRRAAIGAAIVVAVAAIVIVPYTILFEEETTDVGGMEMTGDEVDAMVRESMDVRSLSLLEPVGPSDRAATLDPKVVGGVTEFELSARPARWEYRDRQSIAVWGYEGQIPGPAIHVGEGDKVRVTFTNDLPEATTVHWHGVDVPFEQDGVPGITQEPIKPGDSQVYEFEARPAGTRFYHTHGSSMRDEARQLDMGLSGALIIEPKSPRATDRDYTLVLDEWLVEDGGLNAAMMSGAGHAAHNAGFNLFTINGRAAPAFEPLAVKKGETMRLRLINAGSSTTHPMHLHGHQFAITAIDGNPVPSAARQLRNVVTVSPGETYDLELIADNPGVWMLHCHELHHADAGMMTLLQYDGFEPVDKEHDRESAKTHEGDEAGSH